MTFYYSDRLRREDGFVLPLLLLLIVLATISGVMLTSIASNSIRNAGLLGAEVRALHAVESGAAWIVDSFTDGQLTWLADGHYEGASLSAVGGGMPTAKSDTPNHGSSYWWAESMDFASDTVTLVLTGSSVEGSSRRLEVVFVRGGATVPRPFGTAVVGCNGISLQGSGRIDSYNSQLGSYNQATANANADVMTLSDTGDITVPGNTLIKGGVKAGRNLTISGSSTIQGAIEAVGNILFQGNPTCPATDVNAGGTITTPGNWWCGGSAGYMHAGSDVEPPSGDCDPLNVDEFVADAVDAAAPANAGLYQSGNYNGYHANPVNFNAQNLYFNPSFSVGSTTQVNFNSGVDQIYINGSLSLGGSGIIRIKAPAAGQSPIVKLFVRGNVSLAGGAQIIIEPGAVLELYVTGSVSIGGGLVNQNQKPTLTYLLNGETFVVPTFAIYSSYAGVNGVQVGGNVQVFASVYAPRTSVTVAGSGGVYGSVRGATVTITGAGGIHFDEALGDAAIGEGEESAGSRVARWRELL